MARHVRHMSVCAGSNIEYLPRLSVKQANVDLVIERPARY
jgi:hypothetical protein